jgi:hypothetical protein
MPGDRLAVDVRRRGIAQTVTVMAREDPGLELLPVEAAGGALSHAERAFRDAWLTSRMVP